MSTDKLYYTDSYIKEFEATVTKVADGFVVLDRTAFFPEGGGQASDDGMIDNSSVTSVKETDGEIRHYTGASFKEGQKVSCVLNFDERLRKMRNHSAEHIFCGLVHAKFGYGNVGFHLSDVVTFDFDGELSREQVFEIEREANEAILKNMPVTTWFPTAEEASQLPFRSKLELDEMPELRLVRIGDVDLCACCAPHVRNTGEIGMLKIITSDRHRGGTRLTMVAGLDAYRLAGQYQESVTEISGKLSAPRENVSEWVQNLKEERDRIKYEKIGLEMQLVRNLPVDDNCVFTELSDDGAREYCNLLKEHHTVAAVFTGEKYVIGSNSVNLRELSGEINAAIEGRGGGRPEMISGTAKADSETIHKYFSKYL